MATYYEEGYYEFMHCPLAAIWDLRGEDIDMLCKSSVCERFNACRVDA